MTESFIASNGIEIVGNSAEGYTIDGDFIMAQEAADAFRELFTREAQKPWEFAKLGEVWELTYGAEPTAHVLTDRFEPDDAPRFVSDRAVVEIDDPDITAGRRIWPKP